MEKNLPLFRASDLVAIVNQSLDYAYPSVLVGGEVESFKINQGKFVFFNLKDQDVSVNCFMMQYQLRIPLEDGMKIVVRARPKITKWSKFSLTIDAIKPQGEGTIKKSFEKLRAKLEQEGLFDQERKRILPKIPRSVGVIGSMESAGYADFMRITNERWGGVNFSVYHTAVQGIDAPDQMIEGLKYFNSLSELPEVLVLIRGGGSADDLAAYNDELLVREIAASRIPTLVGVGHEVDTSLSDMVADVRAATPSHAAEILVPDRSDMRNHVSLRLNSLGQTIVRLLSDREIYTKELLSRAYETIGGHLDRYEDRAQNLSRILEAYNPRDALKRGYAILSGDIDVGRDITIETDSYNITAEVKSYEHK